MLDMYGRRFATSWPWAAAICAAMVAAPPSVSAAGAAAQGPTVAVVDFYTLTPRSPLLATPELLAADDTADLLARSGEGRMTVVPRDAVRQAESALGWQGSDSLRFARLRELARAVHADLLVVGRLDRLDLDREGGSGANQLRGVGGMVLGFGAVTVQVFDPRQEHIVFQVQRSTYEQGIVSARVGERLIQRLLEATVPLIMPAIGAGG